MSWQAATRCLHAAGGGPAKSIDFWPPTAAGNSAGKSLTRAAHLGMMERHNKGYVWRWTLTEKGRDWCEGRIPEEPPKPPPAFDREAVLRRLALGVEQAIQDFERLTKKQREVAVYVAKGLTSKEIAAVMGLCRKTVERHRTSLMSRLGVERATEVAVMAAKAGVV